MLRTVDLSHLAFDPNDLSLDPIMRYFQAQLALEDAEAALAELDPDSKNELPSKTVTPSSASTRSIDQVPRRRFQRGRVFKRGSNKPMWVLAFREDCPQPDGSFKRTQRKVVLGLVRTMNKSEAYTVAQPYLEAVNLTVTSTSKAGKTLRSFVAEWESSVAPTLKPSTVRAAKSHLRTHILPALGELSLSAITTRNVQAFVSTLAAKGLTRKSCENVLQTLLSLLTTAKAWRYVFTVFDRSALSLPRDRERNEPRFFTAAQVQQIIAVSVEPYATLWAILAVTGCRAGEILGLKRGDLDFDKHIIRIRRTLDGATRLMHSPKSKSSSADLPMPEGLARRLQKFLASPSCRENESDLVFSNSKGKPMQRDKVAYKL